ncbi:hypothetical protein K431DRAFT_301063 [Polychaeton citri CBS 116435]|uniref:Uncharacterized protein n=1 Tax=Polychaeton citri CBS 116435 TaxID=1314669 RepID=A0A9P4QEF0_9PEZI|nr:hypothetical protein K431DRAFT_301063 [Polychaeton citri CBS 116435]
MSSMRILALAILSSIPTIVCQWTYPPPLERPLTDYTSGLAVSALNFSAGDDLYGGWTTPVGLASFLLYRCTHTPSSAPIYPSNSSFNSTEGHVAADGTWEQMPLYQNGMFGNGFNSGSNPFFSPSFFEGNSTTGDLCWFELYPGRDRYGPYDPTTGDAQRVATVNGDGTFYFATVPFVVKPRRPTGQVVTWKDDGTERGKPVCPIFGPRNGTAACTPSTSASASSSTTTEGGTGKLGFNAGLAFLGGLAVILGVER